MDKNVLFTGHSLGGGLAACAASRSNKRAITFNAMGVPNHYRIGQGFVPERYRKEIERGSKIINYHTRMDILTNAQKVVSTLAKAMGQSREIQETGIEIAPIQLQSVLKDAEPIIKNLRKELEKERDEGNIWEDPVLRKSLVELVSVLTFEHKPIDPYSSLGWGMPLPPHLNLNKIDLLIAGGVAHSTASYLPALVEYLEELKKQKRLE